LSNSFQALQSSLGYEFKNPALLLRALTHRSFGLDNNERLEFLGDSVLGTAISALLYDHFTNHDEGDLSRIRAHLVREESLHAIAQELALPDLIRLSEGEARDGGRLRASILADAYEAIIGAIYLDGGFTSAFESVRKQFHTWITQSDLSTWTKDATCVIVNGSCTIAVCGCGKTR
jgi:ribonuclease-3